MNTNLALLTAQIIQEVINKETSIKEFKAFVEVHELIKELENIDDAEIASRSEMADEIKDLISERNSLHYDISDLEDQVTDLGYELEDTSAMVGELEIRLERNDDKISELEDKIKELITQTK